MDKIRSKPQFRKERSLFFIFSVMFTFIIATALVHRFYNPAVLTATIPDAQSVVALGKVKVVGTKLNFEKRSSDSLYNQPVSLEIITRNEPDSLYIWQSGTKTVAVKQSENKFVITLSNYDDMVVEFRK